MPHPTNTARYDEVIKWSRGVGALTIGVAIECMTNLYDAARYDYESRPFWRFYLEDLKVVLILSRAFLDEKAQVCIPTRHFKWLLKSLRSIARFIVIFERSKDGHEKIAMCDALFLRTQQTRLLLEGTATGDDPVLAKGLFFCVTAADDAVEALATATMRWNSPFRFYYPGEQSKRQFLREVRVDSIEELLAEKFFKWDQFVILADES